MTRRPAGPLARRIGGRAPLRWPGWFGHALAGEADRSKLLRAARLVYEQLSP